MKASLDVVVSAVDQLKVDSAVSPDPLGGQSVQPKFAKIASDNVNNTPVTLVAAVTGKKIRVLCLVVQGTGTSPDFELRSNTTALTGIFSLSVTGNYVLCLKDGDFGHIETVAGQALNFNMTGADHDAHGFLVYCEV